MSDFNLYSVNWQDGMLVGRQHLEEQERFFRDLVRWHGRSTADTFGLIRKSLSGKPALQLNLSAATGELLVEVVRCQAITPDGGVIEINESSQPQITATAAIAEADVPVYLGVDYVERPSVGTPDPQEDPPRVPYLAGKYLLSLYQPPKLPEAQVLKIAELRVSGTEVAWSDGYFPPCLALNAEERLDRKARDYRNRLENLLSLASRAYLAISAGGALSGEKTELQDAFRQTVHHFGCHLAATLDDFVVGKSSPHPIVLVLFFKRLYRVFSTLLNLHPGLKDFLNERFFVKEMNTEVGRYLSMIDAFLLSDYDHRNLGGHLQTIDEILVGVRGVLGHLAQVRKEQLGPQAVATDVLTYRGRTYKVVAYSESRLEQAGELSYLVISIPEPVRISDVVALLGKDLCSDSEWVNMQVRLGLNEARGLGETDPVNVDTVSFGNKVALRPEDMLPTPGVRQLTLIFRGADDPHKFAGLSKMDLIVYSA
jgi:hypothetical protein